MNQKTELIICLGSSCFARGNKKILEQIQQYIKEHNLEEKVIFRGNHCFGKCNKGPILKLGEKFFEQVNEHNLLEILNKELKGF
ncbi:MAG: (2Fe-2S) ferredoxin domain-containing protein [Bacteroidales bacterium]|nr:(2Fe-2S) ferredoxin domain-containing protein [Bacteroidales bacterium]